MNMENQGSASYQLVCLADRVRQLEARHKELRDTQPGSVPLNTVWSTSEAVGIRNEIRDEIQVIYGRVAKIVTSYANLAHAHEEFLKARRQAEEI